MECPFTEEEFKNGKADKLADKLFDEALQLFKRRMERMTQVANPVIKQVYEHQGAMYENIMIPITDGKRMYNVSCNLKEAYETESKAITKAFKNRSSCILSMKLGKNICVKWTNCVTRYKTPVTKIKIPC